MMRIRAAAESSEKPGAADQQIRVFRVGALEQSQRILVSIATDEQRHRAADDGNPGNGKPEPAIQCLGSFREMFRFFEQNGFQQEAVAGLVRAWCSCESFEGLT